MTSTPIEDTFDNRKEYNYISSLFNDLEKIKVAESNISSITQKSILTL